MRPGFVRRRAAVLAVLLLAGCAPRLAAPPPSLDRGGRETLYREALARRRAAEMSVADLAIWVESDSLRRLPGAQASLALAPPDRMRLRVASTFGTAIDLGLNGDSLTAYVPAWKTGMRLPSVRDSLGIGASGGLAYRVFAAAWQPPDDAWRRARWEAAELKLEWSEGGDSLALTIDESGLPTHVRVANDTLEIRARYDAWDRQTGVAWPVALALEDVTHGLRLRCRASRVRLEPVLDPARLAVSLPPGASILTLGRLRAAIERMGASR